MRLNPEDLQCASKIIRRKARVFARKVEFADVDRGDIEQDLHLHVLKRWRSFDPNRAKAGTFISRIVDRELLSMLRKRRAACRDARKSVRLPDECLQEHDGARIPGSSSMAADDPVEEFALRLDVRLSVNQLPADLQVVCALRPNYSIRQLARLTGRSREALRADLRRVKEFFMDAGLADYL